ncbi:hypothetical protein Tco_0729823 [Tanacetum coccineum]|uniref:F-box domain, leucine-rich repeat domain, L domain-like protein n=1 Tax=Tanacetum coccineum TaxID=301880 RepID=A0ABQ4YSR3_9ASTR
MWHHLHHLFVVVMMSADVARSHGGDGSGEDRPPPHHVPNGCMGCFANRGKVKRKPNLGGSAAGRMNTRDKTRNLSLKKITDKKGPTQFDLRPHMESPEWTEINAGIQQHLQKAYNTNKAAFKAQHWVIDPTTGTYDVEKIRRHISETLRRISVACSPSSEMRQKLRHQEYPSLIDTFFVAYTVNGEFLQDENRRIYEEMKRLEATITYTDDEINRLARRGKQRGHIPGVGRVLPARATVGPSTPASESTLNSLHKKVDFMMSLFKSDSKYSDMFSQFESGGASGSGGCGDDEESADDQEDEDEDGDGDS